MEEQQNSQRSTVSFSFGQTTKKTEKKVNEEERDYVDAIEENELQRYLCPIWITTNQTPISVNPVLKEGPLVIPMLDRPPNGTSLEAVCHI